MVYKQHKIFHSVRSFVQKTAYFIQVSMAAYKHRVSLMKHDIILFNKGKARRNNF